MAAAVVTARRTAEGGAMSPAAEKYGRGGTCGGNGCADGFGVDAGLFSPAAAKYGGGGACCANGCADGCFVVDGQAAGHIGSHESAALNSRLRARFMSRFRPPPPAGVREGVRTASDGGGGAEQVSCSN